MKKTRITLLLFVSLFTLTNTCFAQDVPTVYSIIVASTYDTTIGVAAEKSKTQFDLFLRNVAKKLDYDYIPNYLVGNECKKKNVMEVLDNFQCDTADIIVFAYFGHGGRSKTETSEFPQMCLYGEYQSNYVPVEYVKNRLAKHGARITWVIGDCCNSEGEWIKPKSYTADALGPMKSTVNRGAEMDLYPKLFKEFTGVITMCASKKGTFGWSRSDIGMLFNNALTNTINHFGASSLIPGQPWQSVMTVVQNHFSTYPIETPKYPGQIFYAIPQYLIEQRQIIDDNEKEKGKGGKKGGGDNDVRNKEVEKFFAQLYNSKDGWLAKEKKVEELWKEYFTQDAMCRTLTPSGLPIGDKTSVRKYLHGVARRDKISNISILNVKRDSYSGKIVSMDIIELSYE